jgi:hypothetical protein
MAIAVLALWGFACRALLRPGSPLSNGSPAALSAVGRHVNAAFMADPIASKVALVIFAFPFLTPRYT